MNRIRIVGHNLILTRGYSSYGRRKFFEVPYDEQYEPRDFLRRKKRLDSETKTGEISKDLRNILGRFETKDFGFLGYYSSGSEDKNKGKNEDKNVDNSK